MKEAVRFHCARALDDLADRIVCPVHRHKVKREVMVTLRGCKGVRVVDMDCVGHYFRSRPDYKRFRKRSINQTQAIKDLILCNVMQKTVAGAVAIADQRGTIGQEGRSLHMSRLIAQAPGIQTLLHAVFPPECLSCRARVASDDGLCGPCWRDTAFISGSVCDGCGVPMRGDVQDGDRCDDCMSIARPWSHGRAALLYQDRGRALVLALKHGDRHDIVRPAGAWMATVARGIMQSDAIVVPVPLHWSRMVKRRYNQSALIGHAMARELDVPICADLLKRDRATASLDGKSREDRFNELSGAISVNEKRVAQLFGRSVLLVDDVMTSGATLAACADACLAAQARDVCVVTLARVAKDD